MNENYTPTTKEVRRVYSLAPLDLATGGIPNTQPEYAAAQFDRWLSAHDAAFLARPKDFWDHPEADGYTAPSPATVPGDKEEES